MSRTSRAVAAAAAMLAALHAAPPASAHDVLPFFPIELRPGSIGEIYVIDLTGCAADITATSTDPGLVQIYAADMDAADGSLLPGNGATVTVGGRVDQLFVLFAAEGITTPTSATIEVCWVGEDVGKTTGDCMENNCSPYLPEVRTVIVDPNAEDWANYPFGLFFGDPVSTGTGESFLEERADLAFGSRMPIVFARRYSSRFLTEGVGPGPLGRNWRHSIEWDLVANGNYVEIRTPDGRMLRFERGAFDASWTLEVGAATGPAELIDAAGGFKLRDGRTDQIVTFDGNLRATKIEDGRGNSLTLGYTAGRLTSVDDGLGHVLTLTYTSGRITSVSDGTRTVSYAYDGSSRLVSVTDAAGGVTSYGYDAAAPADGLLATLTRPEGNVVQTQVYDAQKRVIRQTDALGNQGELSYDDANGITTTTDATLATQQHTYADRVPTALRFENGQSAASEYDSLGRRTRITDRLGDRTSFTWDAASNRLATQTSADGGVTRWIRTARAAHGFTFHDLTRVEHPDGSIETFTYDANGNVLTRTDAAGNVWTRTYGPNGELLTSTDPDGAVTQYAWNADGTLASATDPEGNVTTYVHDLLGRRTEVHLPDATVRTWVYDELDRVTSFTDEAGHVTQYSYDDNGNLLAVLLPDGSTWSFTYDGMDRLASATDPAGGIASVARDALGRVTSAIDAAGRTIGFTWTSTGRLASVRDGNDQSSAVAYDAEDVPSSVTDATGNAWTAQTDAMGRPIRTTSPLARVRQTTRDRLGRVTRYQDGEGGRTDYAYDALGRPRSIEAAGSAAELERDASGRTTAFERGAARWTVTRDAAGRVVGEADPLGRASSAQLDARGRPIHVDLPGGLGSVDLTWTADGLLERALWSDAVDQPYTYDENGRLLTAPGVTLVRDANGDVVDCNGIAITRDASGRITQMDVAAGASITYTWDAAGLLTQVEDSDGNVMTFTYDAAQRLTGRVFPNGVTEAREYDADGLLTRILTTAPGAIVLADLRFERDDEGRIVTARRLQPAIGTPEVGKTTRTYDLASQDSAFTYDAMGRRTSDDEHQYEWDLAGRLVAAEDVGASSTHYYTHGVEYTYQWNGLGNVESLTWDGVAGSFAWNYGTTQPSIARVAQEGTDVAWNVVLPSGGLLWVNAADGSGATFHHEDERGNTILTTNALAAVVNAYAYDPYGKYLARTGPAAAYPAAEFSLGAQQFATPIGVGFAFGERVYHMPSASTLQPGKPSETSLDPTWNPYSSGVSTAWIGGHRIVLYDVRTTTSAEAMRVYLGVQPASRGVHGGEGWSSCASCHPSGLSDQTNWMFGSSRRSAFGSSGRPTRAFDEVPTLATPGGGRFRVTLDDMRWVTTMGPAWDERRAPPDQRLLRLLGVYAAPTAAPRDLDEDDRENVRAAVMKLRFFALLRDFDLAKRRGTAPPASGAPSSGSPASGGEPDFTQPTSEPPIDVGEALIGLFEAFGGSTRGQVLVPGPPGGTEFDY